VACLGGHRRDTEALTRLGGDVGGIAQALQHVADGRFGLGIQGGAGGGDVLADLVQDLAAAVGGQALQLGLEVGEVAVDQRVDGGGHEPSPCLSRRSTALVKRSHSAVNSSSAWWPAGVRS
jgi:hypothetical protein